MNRLLNYFYLLLDNLDYFGVLALTFLATATAVLAIVFLFGRRNVIQERLARLLPAQKEALAKKPKLLEEEHGLVAKVTKPLHDIIAPSEEEMRKRLRLKLIQGGFRSERAVRNYLALKVILGLFLPCVYVAIRFFYTFTLEALLVACILAAFGYFLPNMVLRHVTRTRQKGIVKALPDALDLMVVCVEAGLGLDMTFKRTGEEIRAINKDLSDEFYLTNLETRAGMKRDESFKNMALRTGVAETHNLMTVLIQTSRFGTSVAQALRIHADAMRVKRRQLAEEKAAKAAVKLIFPLILFIFPALLIVLAGPAALRIVKAIFPVFGG